MTGAYQHVNRKGEIYYLQAKLGAAAKTKYSFVRSVTGLPVPHLPAGYEVREIPESAQVVIRRFKASPILREEKHLLEEILCELAKNVLFLVDVEGRSLIVYTSDMDADARLGILQALVPMDAETGRRMKADMRANANYTKMLRFTLIDPETRRFNMDRWCFMGSIDDWYFIEGDAPLAMLAKKYVRHLGKDSFFELT